MTISRLRSRSAAVTAGFAVALGAITSGTALPASAATVRTAQTSVDSTYLSDTLGLPTDTVIEPVTYDRFQWLLRQSGQYAFIIGSTTDAGFAASVVKADAAARAAKVTKLYWFDPNLTGLVGVRNLDIRNAPGINLAAGSQTIYGNLWKNLVGQYLGNGIKSVPAATRTSVTITADDAVVNDSVDPLFEYRTGHAVVAGSAHNLFFIYDKDKVVGAAADKVVAWVNLSTTADAQAAVSSALTAAGGGTVIDRLDQFAWWKDSANTKHDLAYPDDNRYGGDILTDADNVDGWRVQQITYPELLHVLNTADSAEKNFVVLFGGTWCHNTRAVVKQINKEAQQNGVTTVYNFDLVLDGGTVNGTNGSANPIHVRDNAYSGNTFNFRPSFVYGDLVRTYLRNLVTEYDAHTGNRVAYYPAGNLTAFPDVVRKLQVPFLVNYQRGTAATPSNTAVKRQWIQQRPDATTGLTATKEYMTEWWFTNPSAQLGLDFAIPADEKTLTPAQATQLSQARSSVAFAAESLVKLGEFFGGLPGPVVTSQTVSASAAIVGKAATVTLVLTNTYGRTLTGSPTLQIAGSRYIGVVSGNAVVFTVKVKKAGKHAFTVSYPGDAQVLAFGTAGTLTAKKA